MCWLNWYSSWTFSIICSCLKSIRFQDLALFSSGKSLELPLSGLFDGADLCLSLGVGSVQSDFTRWWKYSWFLKLCVHLMKNKMKSSVFSYIMSCNPLEVERHLGGTSPPSSGSKNKASKKPVWDRIWELGSCFVFGLFSGPEYGDNTFLQNSSCAGLHNFTS